MKLNNDKIHNFYDYDKFLALMEWQRCKSCYSPNHIHVHPIINTIILLTETNNAMWASEDMI